MRIALGGVEKALMCGETLAQRRRAEVRSDGLDELENIPDTGDRHAAGTLQRV